MAIKGVFTSDSGIMGEAKGDFATALLQEVPTGSATLFALTSGMTSENATDTIIHWFEEEHLSGRTTLAAPLTNIATSMTVTDGSIYVPGTILLIESTGEYVLILSTAANILTIQRGFSGSTAVAANTADGVQRIGTALEEGSNKPVALTQQGYPRYNYTQIFRNTWNITGTAQAVDFYTGPKAAKTRRDALLFHGEDIERSLWFGTKSVGVVNNTRFTTMDGLDAMMLTNIVPAGATTTWSDVDDFLRRIFEKNIKGKPNERIAFSGNGALKVLNDIARIEGSIWLDVGATEFGLNVSTWITPYGRISLMTHPLFVESPLWTKDLRVIHPGAMTLKYLRRTFEDAYDSNGTRAGVDADYGVFTTELTFKYGIERTMGRMTGLTKGAAVP